MTSLYLALGKFRDEGPSRPQCHGSICLDELLVKTVVALILDILNAKTPYKRAQAGFDANSVWHRMKYADFSNSGAAYVISPCIVKWCRDLGWLDACPDEVWGSNTINVCVDFLALLASDPKDHDTCLDQIKVIRDRLLSAKRNMSVE